MYPSLFLTLVWEILNLDNSILYSWFQGVDMVGEKAQVTLAPLTGYGCISDTSWHRLLLGRAVVFSVPLTSIITRIHQKGFVPTMPTQTVLARVTSGHCHPFLVILSLHLPTLLCGWATLPQEDTFFLWPLGAALSWLSLPASLIAPQLLGLALLSVS